MPGLFAGLRIVSLCTLASRVLGLVRDIGMASLFGNGPVMDAFSVAFRVPNLFRRLFGEGALTAAFLPIFVRDVSRHGLDAGWKLSSAVFFALTLVLTALVFLGEIILFGIWKAAPPRPETTLLLGLTALMLPYVILICLAAQQSAVLNAMDRFALPALLPVVMNIIWIAGIFWIAPRATAAMEPPEARAAAQGYLIAGCVLIAGVVQFLAQWPALRTQGFRFTLDRASVWEQIREVSASMTPVVLGLTVSQVNTLADSLLAWALAPSEGSPLTMPLPGSPPWPVTAGTASALYFGQRLYQFPLGIFGVALGTVMFPMMSRHAENGRLDLLRRDLGVGLRLVVAVGLPASIGLMMLADPLTALFFRNGAFDAADQKQTAQVVVAYSSAVWAWCGLLIVTRAAYAAGDRRTPLTMSLWAVVVNVVANLILVWLMGGTGLALGTSLSAMFQVLASAAKLERIVGRIDWKRLGMTGLKSFVGSAAMAAAALPLVDWLSASQSLFDRLLRVGLPLGAGIAAYALVAWLTRLEEFWMLLRRDASQAE